MGGRYPYPMKMPLTIPMKTIMPTKVSMKEAVKMLALSPTTDIRHSILLETNLEVKASIGSPMSSMTMMRAKTREKAMVEAELP